MVEFHSFLPQCRVVLISEHTPKHTESLMPICSPAAAREWGKEDVSQEAYLLQFVLSTKICLNRTRESWTCQMES